MWRPGSVRSQSRSLVQKLDFSPFTLSVPPPLSRTNVEDDEAALGILAGWASLSFLKEKIIFSFHRLNRLFEVLWMEHSLPRRYFYTVVFAKIYKIHGIHWELFPCYANIVMDGNGSLVLMPL